MEDLKSRLHFEDINIRCRCIEKLIESIKKKTKENAIDSSSIQIPELRLIFESCQDDSPITSNLAVQAITLLATNNCINVNYAIDKLLRCLKPSSYQSVIKGISSILMYQYSTATGNKIPKYSLLLPKHPWIAVMEDVEDAAVFVVETIRESLKVDYEKGFQAMQLIILYVICNPLQKQKFDSLKPVLLESFLSCHKEQLNGAVQFMKFVPLMQTGSLFKVVEVSHVLFRLSQNVVCEVTDPNYLTFVELLILALLSSAEQSVKFGGNPCSILDLITDLAPQFLRIGKGSSDCVNICLVLLSYLLKSTTGIPLHKVVNLSLELLNSYNISPTVASMLAVSAIHILPEPSLTFFNDSLKCNLSRLITRLEDLYLSDSAIIDDVSDNDKPLKTFNLFEAFTSSLGSAALCVRFSKLLDVSSLSFKIEWLNAVKDYVDSSVNENFETTFSLVVALFLMSPDEDSLLKTCLDTLESIISRNLHLSTRIFIILLFKLNVVTSPQSKLLILNFLPKSAVHKYAIPPVLSILQMMSKNPELKPQAIYLMLQLWKKQNRCFPHLQALLTETNKTYSFDSGVNEIFVSQASAILEICSFEPGKHGQDFLSALNVFLNTCQDEASLPVACLAVDGIIALCKAEVIDIRSTCKFVLPRLRKDKRILVLCRMYKLLSLVPELEVKSCEYDKFMNETVSSIWKQVSLSNDERVLREAFRCLAMFPVDCHILKDLPPAAKENLKLPASMKSTPFEMSKRPEDVLTYIPGYCFMDLLTSFNCSIVLEGYVSFLHSLIKKELQDLPRSIYSQSQHVAKPKRHNDALSKVPEFLCTQIMAKKSPSLQKNFAVGVLFCYEPPLEYGKDGLPLKRSLANQSRTYEQVLTALLSEVNIDTNDWHRSILISSAWGSFMERALFACEEARRAELDLQISHGHLDIVPDGLSTKNRIAWLWVRDRLVGIIKTNVKNTPTTHANAIFSISGLVSALEKFYVSLDENSRLASDECEEFISHQNFTSEYVETIICAMFPDYESSSKVQSWLLTHLSCPNSSANYLIRGCASSSVCHVASTIINNYSTELPKIIDVMLENLSHNSPVLSFYSGVGLGLLIKCLYDAGYQNAGESQAKLLLDDVTKVMKIFNDSSGNQTSSLIALTFCVASLSQSTDEIFKEWISSTCNTFYEKLMDEEKSSMQFEMLCICVTAMIISAVQNSCLPAQNLEDLASWLDMNRLKLPQCSGISVSLGMQIEAYERSGHVEAAEMKKKVSKGWFSALNSETAPTLHCIAALNGLCALFSSGRGLVQVKAQPSPDSLLMLNDLISLMFQVLSAGRNTGLQNICSWEVGRLFSVNSNIEVTNAGASSSYFFLGEKSILKPLINLIKSYQNKDKPSAKLYHVTTCLKSLADPFPRSLPPVNWMPILTPFLQNSDNSEALEAALKIAVYQCSGSSCAANVVSSYCVPPLIHTLPDSCFEILVSNMPNLLLALPPATIQIFLQCVISKTIKSEDCADSVIKLSLQKIHSSLKQKGIKEQAKNILQDAFVSVFKYLIQNVKNMDKYLSVISKILILLPAKLFDSLLGVAQNADELEKVTKIWCYFIKTGEKPLKSLWPYIEEGQHASLEQKQKIYLHIYDCFLYGAQNSESEVSRADKCISLLLEVIGWIKVQENSKYQLLTTGEARNYLMDVCMALIIGSSGIEGSYIFLTCQCLTHQDLLEAFPLSVNRICWKSEWQEAIDKIINWLVMMLKSNDLSENEKYFIKLSLLSLRSNTQFERNEVWRDVICNVISE